MEKDCLFHWQISPVKCVSCAEGHFFDSEGNCVKCETGGECLFCDA